MPGQPRRRHATSPDRRPASRPPPWRDAAYGALAGLGATIAMTLAMKQMHRRLPRAQRYPLPPREIIERVSPSGAARDPRVEGARRTQTMLAHFAYGGLTGALYGAARPRGSLLAGGAWGVAVWAGSYLGWIPAAGILRPAQEHPLRRDLLMIAAHLVWGAGTAASLEALRQAEEEAFASPDAPDARARRPGGGERAMS